MKKINAKKIDATKKRQRSYYSGDKQIIGKGKNALPSIESTVYNFAKFKIPKKQAFTATEQMFLLAGFTEKESLVKSIKLINLVYPPSQQKKK